MTLAILTGLVLKHRPLNLNKDGQIKIIIRDG